MKYLLKWLKPSVHQLR